MNDVDVALLDFVFNFFFIYLLLIYQNKNIKNKYTKRYQEKTTKI
jgi:hypothetical protein